VVDTISVPDGALELGELLGGAVKAVVDAQDILDQRAQALREIYLDTPAGSMIMPPLWFAFRDVEIALEMSATIARLQARQPRLVCRLLNPTSVGLYGYQASAGLKVSLKMGPAGHIPLNRVEKNEPDATPPQGEGI
jgi:hypothetical protein